MSNTKGMNAGKRIKLWVATALIAATLFPTMGADAYQPVRAEAFRSSPLGYVGCHVGRFGVRHHSCLVAYETQEGVRVTLVGWGQFRPILNGFGIDDDYVEELTLPSGSLTEVTQTMRTFKGVRFSAELPRTGLVSLTAWAASDTYFVSLTPSGSCSNLGLHYSLANDNLDGTIGANTSVTGTIGGTSVAAWNTCPRYWTSPTTGSWQMPTLLEEGLLP